MEMGNSKNASEKALLMTKDKKTLEAAMDWIDENRQNSDFEE
jgi:hypothetical protein